jgi:hypothetical protein
MTLTAKHDTEAHPTPTRTRAALTGRAARAAAVAAVAAAALIAGAGAALASPATPAVPGAGHATAAPAAAAGQKNCVASPHTCGYPDATNTGVPASTALKTVPGQVSSGPGWTYEKAGYVEVFGNGATLSGLYIPYNLDIKGSNVTINHVKVVTSGTGDFGVSLRHTTGVTIENSDIYSPDSADRLQFGIDDVYADSVNTTIKADDITNTANGIQINEGHVTGNYIHAMKADPADHVDGLLSTSGTTPANPLDITGNTILNPVDQTSDIALYQDFGPQSNDQIEGNLLAGGGYSLYGGASGSSTHGNAAATNITIANNRFSPLYYPNGGNFGPDAYVSNATGDTFTGNIWDNTLKPVSG